MGWKTFSLIGHSMGGKIALRVACHARDRVTRLVGLSPLWAAAVPFGTEALAFFRSSVDNIEVRQRIIAMSTGNRLPGFWCRSMAAASAADSRHDAYAGYLESFIHDDFSVEAEALDVESMLLSGARDSEASRVQRDGWLKGLAKLQSVVLEECGHWSIHEAPLLTAALVERFLAQD